jgi:hypothetical protein
MHTPPESSVRDPVTVLDNGLALTAGVADQTVSWYPGKKHGLFTYLFLAF